MTPINKQVVKAADPTSTRTTVSSLIQAYQALEQQQHAIVKTLKTICSETDVSALDDFGAVVKTNDDETLLFSVAQCQYAVSAGSKNNSKSTGAFIKLTSDEVGVINQHSGCSPLSILPEGQYGIAPADKNGVRYVWMWYTMPRIVPTGKPHGYYVYITIEDYIENIIEQDEDTL